MKMTSQLKITNQESFVAGLFYIILGGSTVVLSYGLNIGTASRMGPGFFPLAVGILLTVVGVMVFVGSLSAGAEESRITRVSIRKTAIIIAAVVIFGLTIEPLGLFVALSLVIIVGSLANKPFPWRSVFLSIVILTPLVWVIFIKVLAVPFPLWPQLVIG